MSKDLVTLDRPSFLPAVAPDAAKPIADEFGGGIGTGGMPLPVLSIRGKEWRLRRDGEEINLKARNGLQVVLVAARPHVSKRYYEDSYTSGEVVSPTCASADGVTPNVPAPVSKACATCPKNAWGSGTKQDGTPSKAKACNDFKRLVVWAVGLNKEGREMVPAVLDLPATSLRSKTPGVMMLKEYVAALTGNGIPVYGYVATLDFADAEFPQVTFTPERAVTKAEYDRVLELREDEDVQEVLYGGAGEVPGPITESPALEAPAEKKAAKPKPEPKPEPEPEPEAPAEDEGDDDDVLSEIEDLLK